MSCPGTRCGRSCGSTNYRCHKCGGCGCTWNGCSNQGFDGTRCLSCGAASHHKSSFGFLLPFLGLFALMGAAHAADGDDKPAVPLPADAEKALDVMDKEFHHARAVAIDKLYKVETRETKAGHLDVALSVKAEITKLEKAGEGEVDTSDITKTLLVNTFNYTQGTDTWPLTFNKDGTIGGKKSWEENHYKIQGNSVLIYTDRNTLWTEFAYTDGSFANPTDLSGCDWKQTTSLKK